MTPTAWDVRNKLLAILNGARHSGNLTWIWNREVYTPRREALQTLNAECRFAMM